MTNNEKYEGDSKLKDAWLHGMLESTFSFNPQLSKFDLGIHVIKQEVTITGEVHHSIDKWLMDEILAGIIHIKSFSNQVTVTQQDLIINSNLSSRQAFYNWYKDINITAAIKAKLEWSQTLSGKQIEVSTKDGVVTLDGEVDYKANKIIAESIVNKSEHITEIKNNIKVSR